MKLAFEPDLEYQHDAIWSVVNLFNGQPNTSSVFQYSMTDVADGRIRNLVDCVGNNMVLDNAQVLSNLKRVQERNGIEPSESLAEMHFSVEMETGTGKTYVYLRTIYELNKKYGYKKFVIVVPSVPIREGVLKNLEITNDHFQNLYENVPIKYWVYERTKISKVRSFATNDNIDILVINIDSFSKDENVINNPNDKLNGRVPLSFIQSVNPIVIVDEPQNMESDKRRKAIESLNPLCTLRYSATHRNRYNLIYSLNPVKAYDLGLVKQIEVDSVIEENASNSAYVALRSIAVGKKLTAKVSIDVNDKNGVKRKTITVRCGSDLYQMSNNRHIYRDGYMVENIDVENGSITFTNGESIFIGQKKDDLNDEVMKFQIRRTIEEHLRKELQLLPMGLKVLSLFFIDRVANYRQYDEAGNVVPGRIAKWFEDIYCELIRKPEYESLNKYPVGKSHNGYFSQDKKGHVKDTSGESQTDDDTYNLIMRDKESLLDINNPLRFIFTHTALREGWDNPNVFQICTLNETKSELKKRQEIGRGLRLAVNQEGIRIYDKNVNRLTVIANESYIDFAEALQMQIKDEFGVDFSGRIKSKKDRVTVTYKKGFENDTLFKEIWSRISAKTTYRVCYDTDSLIEQASREINNMPRVVAPTLRATKMGLLISDAGISTEYKGDRISRVQIDTTIPDVLEYIQNRTNLTRKTIATILVKSGRLDELAINPQSFMDAASGKILGVLNGLMIGGIMYKKINNTVYEMSLFKESEVYKDDVIFEVSKIDRTIYDKFIPLDSNVENKFAKDCEDSEQVEYYFKLPGWFRIPTPIGDYIPDWAVVFKEDKQVYFVAETKDTGTPTVEVDRLRDKERLKIKCAEAHFNLFDDVEYKVVNSVSGLI